MADEDDFPGMNDEWVKASPRGDPLPGPSGRRTVRIGGSTKAELMECLASAHVQINPAGLQLFADQRFSTQSTPSVVETFEVSIASLGLPHGGTMAQAIEAAAARGLAACPLELAVHLRLLLLDQDEGALSLAPSQHKAPPGSITVVSEALDGSDDTPKGFYLRRVNGVLWLRGYKSWPGHVWQPSDRLVFVHAPHCDPPNPSLKRGRPRHAAPDAGSATG